MKSKLWVTAVAAIHLAGFSSVAHSQENQPATDELKLLRRKIEELEKKVRELEQKTAPVTTNKTTDSQVQELEQKVKVLERNRELDQEAAQAKAKETPRITLGEKGFSFASADGSFGVQLKGLIQADSRTFFHDSGIVGNDSLLLRRARPIVQGVLFSNLDFLFVPDFGGSGPQIFDAYLNYQLIPELQLQAGKFKSPVGLEQLQTDAYTLFNERSLVTAFVPNRDIGFELHGDLLGGAVSYAAGIFNGVGDARLSNNTDFDDNKEFAGRIFFQPFLKSSTALSGLGFGLGGNYTSFQKTNVNGLPNTTGGTLAGYTTDGQQQFFAYNPTNGAVVADGPHWHLSPQAHYYYGPFGVFGEYVISSQHVRHIGGAPLRSATLEHTAWEVTGLINLTGEDAVYNGPVVPRHPFSMREGGWGAWQLVARYAEANIDSEAFPIFSNPGTSAHHAWSASVGLNWWLNRNLRLATSYSHTDFQGGGGAGVSAPAAVTQRNEDVLFTRLQLAF